MNAEFAELWELMSPEEQNQLLAMGTLDERQAMLNRQMQQAELLKQGSGKQYSTGAGAALGGLADVIRAGQGQYMGQQAQAGIEDVLGQKDAGRSLYADAIRRRPQPPTPDVLPALPFSF